MPSRREDAARGLRGDRGLVAELVEHVRLGQLRLGKRRGHLQKGLSRQNDPPVRHRPDIARELQAAQGLKIPGRPVQRGSEGVDVLGADMQAVQVVQGRLQPCRDQEAPLRRQVTDEEAEGRGAVIPSRR
ncbi:hypothetical protein GCM10010451_38660 [Streptomyces virens]|uniref:Uncharacterized protein n=1 Tax=Streptomyces virens TaxID=285572 RepID=A0ABP6PQV1_9ACTN